MIGYMLILAPCVAVAYYLASFHSTMGDVAAAFIGIFCVCMLLLWRGRKPDTFDDRDSGV